MVIVVAGVSGTGKSTVGALLANSLNWKFVDADNFHPPQNIEKMRHGIPLTDTDRQPWLNDLRHTIQQWLDSNQNVVLACSALKQDYRERLMVDGDRVRLVYLKGSYDEIRQRLQQRRNHFMTEQLLKSQFDALEEPEDAICVDISEDPEAIVRKIQAALGFDSEVVTQ